MSWLSGLAATVEPASRRAGGLRSWQIAQRKAQEIELLARRAVEEIALVAARVGALVQLGPALADNPPHIMAGGEAVGAKLARESDQVGELDALVAQGARHRGAPGAYSSAKRSITPVAEAAFIIEHIMGDAEPVGDLLGIVDVLARRSTSPSAWPLRHDRKAGASRRSLPRRCARRARPTTELSTPPDMATTMRASRSWASKIEADRHGRGLFTRSSPIPARRRRRLAIAGDRICHVSRAIFPRPASSVEPRRAVALLGAPRP